MELSGSLGVLLKPAIKCKSVEFKKYLHEVCDAGSRLLFKFRSGMRGLNEELSRHRGRERKTECSLCGDECENVSHVLWEWSA